MGYINNNLNFKKRKTNRSLSVIHKVKIILNYKMRLKYKKQVILNPL